MRTASPPALADASSPIGQHDCGRRHQCFVCGCTECGYTVDTQLLGAAVDAHLTETAAKHSAVGGPVPRSELIRQHGQIARVLTCRTCGRRTHGLCARNPLEPRPWLTPAQLPPAEHLSGLRALQAALQRIVQTPDTYRPHSLVKKTEEATEATPETFSASPALIKTEAPEEAEDEEEVVSPRRSSPSQFPSSPLTSMDEDATLTTATVTVPFHSMELSSSPAARPPRSPPPPPSSVPDTTLTSAKRRGPKRRAATGAAGAGGALGQAAGLFAGRSLAKSESPAGADAFFCSLDCALRLELRPNPFFDHDMSQRYSQDAARRLKASEPIEGGLQSAADARGDDPAVLQVRYEAWLHYFAEDSVVHGRFPPLFPPCFVDADERVLAAVARVLTPAGQAERLCGLDPAVHPVGSVFVVPEADLWEDLRLVDPGTSTSFVGEQMALYLSGAVTPTCVTQKRPREATSTALSHEGPKPGRTATGSEQFMALIDAGQHLDWQMRRGSLGAP